MKCSTGVSPVDTAKMAVEQIGDTGKMPVVRIMPEISWDSFERYRQKGLDARRAGQWDSARVYLLEAARAMAELSKEARGEDLREGRRQIAAKLLDLARDCEEAKK